MNIVIGSGPAGIACAYALLEKGKEVLVIDGGFALEKRQRELLTRLKGGDDPEALEELKTIQNDPELTDAGLHTKLTYGSDFPYRGAEEYLDLETSGTGLLPSLAVGGFSNVWGAAALPYLQSDIEDWPVTAQELAVHYEKIVRITGLSAKMDDLSDLFPIHTPKPSALNPSSQASRLLKGLVTMRAQLRLDGIHYGSSRVMVGPNQNSAQACVYCGQCIRGCPYSCIYNSGDDLRSLLERSQPGLRYRADAIVTTIKETPQGVKVSGFDRLSRAPVTLEAERVFVAAGVISSTRIILKSLEIFDQPVEVKDSQYFLFPLLSLRGSKESLNEAANTLSQLFVEIQNEEISPHTIHLQLYTYNDVITKTLGHRFRYLPSFLRRALIGFLQHRLIVVQGFLHSRHSGKINLSLKCDPATAKERLLVEGISSAEAKSLSRKVIRKMGKHLMKLGLFPIAAAMEFCLPGRGFHSGGSFPMRAEPGPLEADIYGRVGGAKRIHVVDSSIFPSVPATTITLTAMANAHRIGSSDF